LEKAAALGPMKKDEKLWISKKVSRKHTIGTNFERMLGLGYHILQVSGQ
jgi:hypothetical protein